VRRDIQPEGKNSLQGGISMTSLGESPSRVETSRKTAMGREPGQNVTGKRKSAFEQNPRWPKAWRLISQRLQGEGVRIKASQYDYNQGKSQDTISKVPRYFTKGLKSESR